MRIMSLAIVAAMTFSCSLDVAGQTDQPSKLKCFNSEAIQWVYPGKFKTALEKAKKQNRIILMKGLGFGLDELGTKCATKGCW